MPNVTVELDVPELEPAAATDPARTVVLVVDLQNESCHPEGAHYGGPEAMEAVETTAEFLGHARQAGARVVWLQSIRSPEQALFTVYGRKPYRIDGTWNVEFTPPLEPAAGERVVRKYTHDCFNNTDMEPYLRRECILGPLWTFVVVGASFTGCVHHAITGLSMREYRVLVPMDCVAPRTSDRALVALHRIGHRSYGHNVTPLTGWKAIAFDKDIVTNAKGIPIG